MNARRKIVADARSLNEGKPIKKSALILAKNEGGPTIRNVNQEVDIQVRKLILDQFPDRKQEVRFNL